MVAAWLLWTGRAEQVRMVPSFAHPFARPMAPFDRRVAACRALAALVGPAVEVDSIEATLPTPSFTIHVLEALSAREPSNAFFLVVGADILDQAPSWKDWPKIQAQFCPLVVGRGERTVAGSPSFPAVSSTEIRQRLSDGAPVDHLVPAAVLRAWEGAGP
jgi:nicotinate-nucleotide adenylyltransferase